MTTLTLFQRTAAVHATAIIYERTFVNMSA